MKIAYLDCFSGISGDMTIAAFLDAGLSFDKLSKSLAKLKIKGYTLRKNKVKRGAISGIKFDCSAASRDKHSHRSLKEILRIIESSSLNRRVKDIAKAIFSQIGAVEAKVHGISSNKDVHLHELGDVDSIIDIVGTAIAIDELGIDEVYASRITLGRSYVNSKHGVLPVPSPATIALLKGAPVRITAIEHELVTPTGAGILKTLAKSFGDMPQMKVSAVGYGAGTKELGSLPNLLRVIIGTAEKTPAADKVMIIEANIDDMNPQYFEYLFERLFKSGALDAYTTNIQMKKSRPAFKLTVLADKPKLEALAKIIFSETTTIGVRFYEADRLILDRKVVKVKTRYGQARIKISRGPDGIVTASPEYEDCVSIARNKNVPLKVVYEAVKERANNAK